MASLRGALSIFLLLGAFAVLRLRDVRLLAAAVVLAGLLRYGMDRRGRMLLMLLVPLAWFLAALFALQWLAGRPDPELLLRAAAVILLSTSAFRAAPWKALAGRVAPGSPFYTLGLFLLFVRHFTQILAAETQRTLRSRAWNVTSFFRPGGPSSLAWAMANIVRRTLDRAERFYGAQLLKGLVP